MAKIYTKVKATVPEASQGDLNLGIMRGLTEEAYFCLEHLGIAEDKNGIPSKTHTRVYRVGVLDGAVYDAGTFIHSYDTPITQDNLEANSEVAYGEDKTKEIEASYLANITNYDRGDGKTIFGLTAADFCNEATFIADVVPTL